MKIKQIIRVLRKEIGLLLAGFDVVIDNVTGNHAVIDINVFPSYDNFPNFFDHLLDCIEELRDNPCNKHHTHEEHFNSLSLNLVTERIPNCNMPNGFINVASNLTNINVLGMNI